MLLSSWGISTKKTGDDRNKEEEDSTDRPPTLMTYIDIVEEHAVWWNRMREIEEHHNPPHPASNELSILLDYDTIDNKYISREKKIYLPGDQHR